MKKLLFILFLSPVMMLHGQKVNFDWAKQMGGSGIVDARGLATVSDAAGNIYTTGFFKGRVDFDPGPGIYYLDPQGTQDFYVSKLDSGGKFLWVKQMDIIGQFLSAGTKSIAIDADANIFVTGEVVEFVFSPTCFVCKLDSSGNLLWTRQIDGRSSGTSIKTDVSGNVYTAGLFSGQVDFDPGPGNFLLGNAVFFTSSAFVCKLDANGNFLLAKEVGGYYELNPGGGGSLFGQIATDVFIAVDELQGIYVLGSFYGTVDFDPGPSLHNLTEVSNIGPKDMFVLKLTAQGNFSWVKQIGGSEEDVAISIGLDAHGNIYTTGNFTGTADFDPGHGVYHLISPNNISNTGISKLDRNGNFIWAKQLVGGSQWCYSATLDGNGNLYTTGYFGSTLDFDPGTGTYNLSSTGYDVFISKLNSDGNFVWAKQIGGTATIISNSTVVDPFGNLITTGYFFSGQVDFDPGIGFFPLAAGEGENIFIHKMSQCLGNTTSVINISACKNYDLNGQTYTISGEYTQTLTNAAGCDSIITLHLDIKPVLNVMSVSACNSYSWNGHHYSSSGVYTDTLITVNGCDSIIRLQLAITPAIVTSINHSICEGQSFEGHTVAGTYTDTLVAGNGCDSIVTLHLEVLSGPSPDLGADRSLCAGDSLVLDPGTFTTYTWQDGSMQNRITVKKPGLYSVAVTGQCGSGRDEVVVTEGICDIYFPKAFTPNNDGLNDWFKILGSPDIAEYHLTIYNRWGQKVFETFDYSKGWNGSFKGQVQPMQTFVWYCEFRRQGHTNRVAAIGVVTLVR